MTTTPTNPQLSKTLGALLGVHAGDSLGATLEFQPHHQIKATHPTGHREITGGGPFSWPAGAATDDTDLTRCVLLAYHTRHKSSTGADNFDIATHAADWMLKWYTGDWPNRSPGIPPIDMGGATVWCGGGECGEWEFDAVYTDGTIRADSRREDKGVDGD
ncbi:hypothetical protein P280DRAFT_467045 [Massarina eburnea CBS 473.64]|uniref:ADP-ribosylglycohydrolase n=1 Tax=Massarina eburnea CBS 473.64 TaxID=1395130 RepID=A0A6A6S6N7_9PLEO|nr:hypothetical protein P280DRAFT_467045 [Massarina eburnea CBS 473.64]